MISFEERYNFYTNGIFNGKKKYIFDIPKKYLHHVQNDILYTPINFVKNDHHFRSEIYNKNISSYLTIEDDGFINNELPCFQKTRTIKDHSKMSIIQKMHIMQPWQFYLIFWKISIS
jgi:hypothetical protein